MARPRRPTEPSLADLRRGPSTYRQSDRAPSYDGRGRASPGAGLVVRLRLLPVDVRRLGGGRRDGRGRGRAARAGCRERALSDEPGRGAAGRARRRRRGASTTCWPAGRGRRRPRRATCSSATATATGPTACASSSTTIRHGVDLVDPRTRPPRGDPLPDPPRAPSRSRASPRVPPPPARPQPGGAKLSKADGDTGVRDLPARPAGRRAELLGVRPPRRSAPAGAANRWTPDCWLVATCSQGRDRPGDGRDPGSRRRALDVRPVSVPVARRSTDETPERGDVAAVGAERVDERRGDDDAVGAGRGDGSDVGRAADAEADRDRHGRDGADVGARAARPSAAATGARPVTPTSETQ